jgi:Domain of unknown function (DUF4328)
MSGSGSAPYRSLRHPAQLVIGLLVVGLLVDAAACAVELGNFSVLDKLNRGIDVPVAEVTDADDRTVYASIAQLAVYVPTVIAFVVWFSRAYRNLERLGIRRLRFRPGWSIGAWFVPILAWYRPKQMTDDIWRASAPHGTDDWHRRKVSTLIHWWWGVWIAAGLLGYCSRRLYVGAETLEEQVGASTFSTMADTLFMVAAVMAILVVRAVTARQEALGRAPRPFQPDVQRPPDAQALQPA